MSRCRATRMSMPRMPPWPKVLLSSCAALPRWLNRCGWGATAKGPILLWTAQHMLSSEALAWLDAAKIEYDRPESPQPSFDFKFDAVEICGGSGVLSKAMANAGLSVCVPMNLSRSLGFDVTNLRLLEWVMFMLDGGWLAAVICEPVCATFSAAQHPASRSYSRPVGYDPSDPKTHRGNQIALRCFTIA